MDARLLRNLSCVSALLFLAGPGAAQEVIPLAVREGHCELVVGANHGPCFLVLGSLASSGRQARVTLQADYTSLPASLPREVQKPLAPETLALHAQVERLRRMRHRADNYPPPRDPPRNKTFSLFVADSDLENPAGYVQIPAELRGIGKHVQVYLDSQDPLNPDLDVTITEVARTFDQEVMPWSRARLGNVADIDRDGRFTILLSSRLQRLQSGKVALDGFVRGSDFLREVGPPFSNRCDMMYLNANLKAGPHLRTVLAHEFTHAVTFCEHVLNNPPGHRHDEESWLSEGLAHVVEDLHGHGWSNLDYRVSAYLSQPERYPLVVSDYYGSGLWRTPGTRGSVYLFLRWCYLLGGPELPWRLIQSPAVGIRNLEEATGRSFAELFRAWTVSMIRDDAWRIDRPLNDRVPRPQDPSPARRLCGPSFSGLQAKEDFPLMSTATKFIFLPACESNRRVRLRTDAECKLQATLVSWDRERSLLEVRCRRSSEDASLVLEVTAHNKPIDLKSVTWEKLLPSVERTATGGRELTSKSHSLLVGPEEARIYTLLDFLPAGWSQELVIKVHGTDSDGREITGIGYLPAAY